MRAAPNIGGIQMKRFLSAAALAASLALFVSPVTAQQAKEARPAESAGHAAPAAGAAPAEPPKLPWITGPEQGRIAGQATIKLEDKFAFLNEQATSTFLEMNGNPPRPGHFTVAPVDGDWFAVFSFDADGYVKDNEKIDADSLLESMKADDEQSNAERQRLGMPAIHTDGWAVPPHYDSTTRRLEWGVALRTDSGEKIVNYTSRLLGREGVMKAVLVTSVADLERDRVAFNQALTGFEYMPGHKYEEFRSGDKMAAYGLGALVLGGAAAAASKTGAGKAILKGAGLAILAGGAALWGLARKFLGRKKNDGQ
jgi:uncharacterized membrane-anchored protein